MKKNLFKYSFSLILAAVLGGCYPMPEEGDFSVIPMSNNPDFNRDGENPSIAPNQFNL